MAAPNLRVADDDRLLPDPVPEEDARASFDRAAQRILGISGDEFLRRWDAGEFDGLSEDEFGRKVIALVDALAACPPARPGNRWPTSRRQLNQLERRSVA